MGPSAAQLRGAVSQPSTGSVWEEGPLGAAPLPH